MKRLTALAIFITFSSCVFSQENQHSISLIPTPVSMQAGAGSFILNKSASIELSAEGKDAERVADFLSKKLSVATGYSIPIKAVKKISGIPGQIKLSFTSNPILGNEGYELTITPNAISLKANAPAGLFYGMQTLLQLFPKEIESKTVVKNVAWNVPSVSITDYPRFAWRGFMFDVSRHFFTKQQVKDFIDNMVEYKYNLLHLHLTDDQGWRIEIKSLPNLTKVGAWRANREAHGQTQNPRILMNPKLMEDFIHKKI